MEVIWKTVPDFEKYEASNEGEVKNKITNKTLKFTSDNAGYLKCGLSDKNNKRITMRAHQIIAKTFIPNPENKPTVDHIDNNKGNNNVSNLKWATMKEQNDPNNKITKPGMRIKRPVWKCDNDGNKIEKFQSLVEAAADINIAISTLKTNIQRNLRNENKLINGFKYEYENYEDLEDEIWEKINPDFINNNDGYKISNKGRVKNKYGYIHSQYISSGGYSKVNLSGKDYNIHRLVANSFILNPNNYPIVNHIDGNKNNNNCENLEWCTAQMNSIHSIENGLNSNPKRVFQYDFNGNFIKEYSNCVKAYQEVTNNTNTDNCISGCALSNAKKNENERFETCYNFIWIYPDNKDDKPKDKILDKPITTYLKKNINKLDQNNNIINTYKSMHETSRENNISMRTLGRYLINGKIYNNFKYSYAP
jgi:hypothetical protein